MSKVSKKRKLEDCYQQLYQAQANNDKVRIKIWQDIIKKLEAQKLNTDRA